MIHRVRYEVWAFCEKKAFQWFPATSKQRAEAQFRMVKGNQPPWTIKLVRVTRKAVKG